MSIEYTKADTSTRAAVYDALLTFWDQRWTDEFQREFMAWRYERRLDGETFVAMSGAKCIGLVDTFVRPYFIDGRQVVIREPCDWFCLPGNRGVGMRLMKWMATQEEPLLGVGLPKTAISIARRMNWTRLLDTYDFVLPITVRRVVGAVVRKARLGNGSVTRFLPRWRLRSDAAWRKYREMDGEVEELAPAQWPEEDLSGPYADYGVAPIVTRSYVQWLAACPSSLGNVFLLSFRIGGEIVGLSICRIERSKVGCKARLIHIQSFRPRLRTLQWMIAENVQRASLHAAESFHCRSSCPVTNAALLSLGSRRTAADAVFMDLKGLERPSGPVNMTFLRGDDAMIPSLIGE